MASKLKKQQRGFTIFFASLVASLALAIGLAIFDLSYRELTLASTVALSQYAIYAADTGAECALYWDSKATPTMNGGSSSVFGTSLVSTWAASGSGVYCNSQDISALWNTPPVGTVLKDATSATTTFQLKSVQNTYCATVQVAKYVGANDGFNHTVISSFGFNTCVTGSANQVEREYQVSY